MKHWTRLKILKVILYILLAFVFINCLLFELRPTLYPEWLREGIGFGGLLIIFFWFIVCIINLVNKIKKNNKK